jgi:MFS family permease
MFWLTTALALVGMMVIAVLPAAPRLVPEFATGSAPHMRPVWLLALSVFLLHAVMTLLFVSFPPLLVDVYGLELQAHWKLYVPTMLVSVLVVFPALRRIGARLAEHRYLHWGFLALAVATALLPHSSPWFALGAVLTVYFIGFNLLEAGMPAVLSRVTGHRGRGRKMGIYSTFQFLGAFLGGVTGGMLLAGFGSAGALHAAAVACGLWGALLMYLSSGFFPTGEAA